MKNNNLTSKIIKVPDAKYKVWFDISIESTKIIKPKGLPVHVFKDLWHPKLDKQYIRNCLGEPIRRSNYVNRIVYYVFTNDGEEGFIPVPKYAPIAFQQKTKNPPIMFLYKVSNEGLFYFK